MRVKGDHSQVIVAGRDVNYIHVSSEVLAEACLILSSKSSKKRSLKVLVELISSLSSIKKTLGLYLLRTHTSWI